MLYYSQGNLNQFRVELATLEQKYNELLFGYHGFNFRVPRAREFAMQGFIRRLGTIRHCVESLFGTLPPDFDKLPSADRLHDSDIIVQSFVFNLFGCADNLAWIWVEETGVTKPDGTNLPINWVGLGSKHCTVRNSLSHDLQELLTARKPWFEHMETLRHALAHRIPLYIPPYAVAPANQAEHNELEQNISRAVLEAKPGRERWLRSKQRKLMFFRPWVTHSYTENAPVIVLHPQMLADFATVHELGRAFLVALRAREAQAD